MQFAKDMGIHEFVLEGNSLIISNSLAERSLTPILVAPILYEIVSSLHVVRHVEFSHVRKQGSRSGHLLAKHAFSIDNFSIWIEENPCFLEQALVHDVISIS